MVGNRSSPNQEGPWCIWNLGFLILHYHTVVVIVIVAVVSNVIVVVIVLYDVVQQIFMTPNQESPILDDRVPTVDP